tara:strand:- start:980 stop:2302 length:1323 start_codon:yes stop_codon:yes gene_type:complete
MAVFGTIDGKAFGNTVAVTQNDATVTKNAGDAINVGDILELINVPYIVKQVNSTTSIELHKPYVAATNNSLGASSAVRRTAPKAVAEYVVKGGDSNAYDLVFADATEQSLAVNRKRGITSPGWWLYRSFTDVEGTTRHKAECIAFVNMAASAAVGDDADDSILGDFNSVIAISSQPASATTYTPAGAVGTFTHNGAANGSRTAGTYTVTNAAGSASGSGADFTVVVAANGTPTVTLVSGGTGYVDNETITIADSSLGGGGGAAVVVTVTAKATAAHTFSVTAASTGQAAAFDGAANAGATGSRTAGTYAISATGGTGSGATFSVVIAANGSASITMTNGGGGYTDNDTLTLSRTGTYGGASNVTVNVNGINNGTLTYQWQKRTSSSGRFSNVSGATSATLALTSQVAANNGNQFRVKVNNGVGATEVTSNTATLTVTDNT